MKNKIAFLLCIISILVKANDTQKFISDSLIKKTYKELSSVIYTESISVDISKKYAEAYLLKAKKDTSKFKIALAYHHLSQIGRRKDDIIFQLQYLDSVIEYSKNLHLKKYPEFAYFIKGIIHYEQADYKNSLDNYLKSFYLAREKNNTELIFKSKHGIGILKNKTGNYKEAIKIFNECKNHLKKSQLTNNNYLEDYLATLSGLSDSYRKTNELDSSSSMNRIGVKMSYLYGFNDFTAFFTLSEAINLNVKKKYKTSIDSINKAMYFLKKLKDTGNMAFANFYKAKSLIGLKKDDEAISYLKKVDTIFNNPNYINPDIRENYEILINYYKKKDDLKKQLHYIQKLLYIDSIIYKNDKYLTVNLIKKYDTEQLLSHKDELLTKTSIKNNKLHYILIFSAFIILVITFGLLLNYRKKKIYQQKFEHLLGTNEKITSSTTVYKSKPIEIPKEICDKVLLRLDKFKLEKGYLEPQITISLLAKEIDTNTKYLSKIINHYEQKSFINFINELRINHIIEELKNDKQLRKYTIAAISEKAGFKNSQSFSQAFYKKAGLYPSVFIKKMISHSDSK